MQMRSCRSVSERSPRRVAAEPLARQCGLESIDKLISAKFHFIMELHIRLVGRRGLAVQIYQQMRAAILRGQLVRGERIPPTRELAARLDVSRNTVSLAYEWLVAEGLLSGRSGAGTFVESGAVLPARPRLAAPLAYRAVWDTIELAVTAAGRTAEYDFTIGTPDTSLFPFDTWRRLSARETRAAKLPVGYSDPAGHPALRAAVARYIAVSRGVMASADDVIITTGARHAFELIGRVLIDAGARVAVEDPGYPPPRLLFSSFGASVSAVAVDEGGLDVASLPDDARLVYVTPSHQYPLGMPMSHARKVALLEWAARRNAVIIEDDYDSEFRFGGRPLETLHSLDLEQRDAAGCVIYVGSFSKSLLPHLRLGFLVAPPALRAPLRAANFIGGWYTQWPLQGTLASFIERGHFARHVRRMRRVYSERYSRIVKTLTTELAPWLAAVPSVTGMHITAILRRRGVLFEGDLADRALAAGVGFNRLSVYYAGRKPRAGVVLGYGAVATAKIEEGLARLRQCLIEQERASVRKRRVARRATARA